MKNVVSFEQMDAIAEERATDPDSGGTLVPTPRHLRGVDHSGFPVVYLLPADLVAVGGDAPRTMTTVLGSCVSVCLWDRRGRGGGMTHYLLPRCTPGSARTARYGDVAIPTLISRLLGLGAERGDLRAKIFGGAHVLASIPTGARTLGGDNVQVAVEGLRAESIQVISEDVGGTRGRKLAFNTVDGTALVWRL
jgi:chemotaxis protein CheD